MIFNEAYFIDGLKGTLSYKVMLLNFVAFNIHNFPIKQSSDFTLSIRRIVTVIVICCSHALGWLLRNQPNNLQRMVCLLRTEQHLKTQEK
jgi:hypothetical protein